MYFNATISCTTKLLKPLLVFAFCMAAGLAGLTQITQHRSHPIDVYVGYVIGVGIGVYLVSPSRPGHRLLLRSLLTVLKMFLQDSPRLT